MNDSTDDQMIKNIRSTKNVLLRTQKVAKYDDIVEINGDKDIVNDQRIKIENRSVVSYNQIRLQLCMCYRKHGIYSYILI